MNPNETIGKWAVEKGLLDCWHDFEGEKENFVRWACSKCGKRDRLFSDPTLVNVDYSIYENIAPVLDKLEEEYSIRWLRLRDGGVTLYHLLADVYDEDGEPLPTISVREVESVSAVAVKNTDLPTTLRDMVSELISKGEV